MITEEDFAMATQIAAEQGAGCWRLGDLGLEVSLGRARGRLSQAAGMFGWYVEVDKVVQRGRGAGWEIRPTSVGFFGTLEAAVRALVEASLATDAARRLVDEDSPLGLQAWKDTDPNPRSRHFDRRVQLRLRDLRASVQAYTKPGPPFNFSTAWYEGPTKVTRTAVGPFNSVLEAVAAAALELQVADAARRFGYVSRNPDQE